jgi:hypothetical protein
MTYHEAAIHEAGHVIATLGTGCLLYDCTIGRTEKSVKNSMGHISRGTQTDRQSAVIGISGAMSDFLHANKDFDMDTFLRLFETKFEFSSDRTNMRGYSPREAAYESKKVLLLRWEHLERLIEKLSQPRNHNRVIGAAELFQMASCRLLDSRKLPVAKRKVQTFLCHLTEVGYHQWSNLPSIQAWSRC